MQPTEKYYEHDAYRRAAVGHILAAEPDSRTGGGRIALDGTVFYLSLIHILLLPLLAALAIRPARF